MPTYEYECDACGHRFELFQPMGSEPRKSCPSCKKRRVRRLIGGGSGFLFRGSGFYQTDYRSADYKKRAAAEAGSGSSGGSSDGAAGGKSSGDAPKKGADSSEKKTPSPKKDPS